MNILNITSWYPTKEKPGFGIFIKEHTRAIQHAGNKVKIVHLNIVKGKTIFKKTQKTYTDNNIPTHEIRIESLFWKLIYQFIPIQKYILSSYIRKQPNQFANSDIIHSHVLFPMGIIGHTIAKKLNKPHIITEHWTRLDLFFYKSIYARAGIKTYRQAAKVLPVSQFLKNKIASYSKSSENIEVVPNIISSDSFKFKEKPASDRHVKFVAIANWHFTKVMHKRPDLILNSLAAAKNKTHKKISLKMIGDGNMLDDLIQQARQLNIDVSFPGRVDKNHIVKALQESHFFLHASNSETFCVVLAEALKTGTPAIVSKVEAIPELMKPETGFIVENTVEAWTNAILTAIETPFHHQKIADYYKEKYTYEAVGNYISEIYQSVAGQ